MFKQLIIFLIATSFTTHSSSAQLRNDTQSNSKPKRYNFKPGAGNKAKTHRKNGGNIKDDRSGHKDRGSYNLRSADKNNGDRKYNRSKLGKDAKKFFKSEDGKVESNSPLNRKEKRKEVKRDRRERIREYRQNGQIKSKLIKDQDGNEIEGGGGQVKFKGKWKNSTPEQKERRKRFQNLSKEQKDDLMPFKLHN